MLNILENYLINLPYNELLNAGLILFVAYFIGLLVTYIATSKLIKKNNNPELINLISKIIKNLILLIAIVSALGTLGIDISAMVAGLGITGFALGFAMKDILSNLISGLLILLYKPFNVNDKIKIDKYDGIVLEINLRYTTIKQDDEFVLVPNSFLYSKPIVVNKNS